MKSILQFLEEAQLRWYGHVRRMSTSRTAMRWLKWKPNTARPRGRPRKRWMDNVKEASVEVRGSTLDFITVHHKFYRNILQHLYTSYLLLIILFQLNSSTYIVTRTNLVLNISFLRHRVHNILDANLYKPQNDPGTKLKIWENDDFFLCL